MHLWTGWGINASSPRFRLTGDRASGKKDSDRQVLHACIHADRFLSVCPFIQELLSINYLDGTSAVAAPAAAVHQVPVTEELLATDRRRPVPLSTGFGIEVEALSDELELHLGLGYASERRTTHWSI